MRDLGRVVNRIKEEVPVNYSLRDDLFRILDKIVRDSKYKAPEVQSDSWNEVAMILEKFLGDPNSAPWKTTVSRVFGGLE